MDRSLFEQGNSTREQQNGSIAFGRITKVYPEERLCEVKTFMGRGSTDDNHLPKCQWISGDSNPDGDEAGTIPRVNSYGLVFYISGEPFIFGFWSPTGTAGSREPLNEGDRILKTVGGNKVILRAHGEIEIQSTPTCRTFYFPDQSLINTLCRNYELRADGGTVDWINDGAGATLYRRELRDGVERTNVIIEERGSVDGTLISRTSMGAGADVGTDAPVWTHSVAVDGTTELFVRAPGAVTGYKHTIKPDGTSKLDVAGKTTITIDQSGETTIDIGPGKVTLSMKPDGSVTLTTAGKMDVTASGKVTIKGANIDLDGGGGLEKVLTTPSAVSQFTGLPLLPGSGTVKASK
jgi:hypothetical protein